MQWKTPQNLSSWVQRSGRAARGFGRKGFAVMIVEKSAYEVSSITTPKEGNEGRTTSSTAIPTGPRQRRTCKPAAARFGADYGVKHGSRRGQHSGKHDTISAIAECMDVPHNAVKEGLYLYIQTTNCRRRLLANVFENVNWSKCSFHTEVNPITDL